MKKYLTVLLMAAMLLSAAVCHAQGSGAEADQGVSGENGEMPVSSEISQGNRTLIVYFSVGNNAAYPEGIDASTSASLVLDGENLLGTTEYLAYLIRKNAGGDVHGIQTIEPYPADFDAVVDQNHDEMDEGALPRLVESRLNMGQYDTVFIGYPIGRPTRLGPYSLFWPNTIFPARRLFLSAPMMAMAQAAAMRISRRQFPRPRRCSKALRLKRLMSRKRRVWWLTGCRISV